MVTCHIFSVYLVTLQRWSQGDRIVLFDVLFEVHEIIQASRIMRTQQGHFFPVGANLVIWGLGGPIYTHAQRYLM